MKIIIFYHRADNDGLLSGHIAQEAHWVNSREATMQGVDYGDKLPTREELKDYTHIYILDFSWDILLEKPLPNQKIIWIDHHKSAIEKYKNTDATKYCIEGVAACRLTWQWFNVILNYRSTLEDYYHRRVSEPYLVQLIGEYDVWDHRDPNATIANLGLTAVGYDILELNAPPDKILKVGRYIQTYQSTLNKRLQENAYIAEFVFEGVSYRTLVINGRGNSLTFEGHPLLAEVDFLCMWVYTYDDQVRVSLYHTPTRKDIDLSRIAKAYGGGGHPGACGFIDKNELGAYGQLPSYLTSKDYV